MAGMNRQTGLPNRYGRGVIMNQECDTAGAVPATVKLAGPSVAPRGGVDPGLGLPEDPFSRRARRREARSGGRARLSGTPALVLLASLIVSLLAASSAPTPLYAIYQQHWGFSPITTTIVYGVYALTVLASLLTLGRLSDYVGRRPVLLAALAVQVISMVVFATADGVGGLLAARVIQGLSTGAALGAIGAAMLDIDTKRGALANAMSPGLGSGTGALLSALFVQYLPAPTHLVYLALIGVIVVQAAGVALLRETVTRSRVPAAALVPEVRLPRSVRGPLLAAAPVVFAVWALGGLYGALGPSLVRALTGSSSAVLGGGSLTLLTVTAVISTYLLRDAPARSVMLTGIAALVAGVAITLVALSTGSAALFFAGTAVSGIGFGTGFQGGIRTVVPVAAPHERAGVLSLLFTVSYLGLGVPAVAAGFLAVHGAGLTGAARDYGAALILLAAFALAALTRPWRAAAR
jgi:predicted MFS family arabinose efflux permease